VTDWQSAESVNLHQRFISAKQLSHFTIYLSIYTIASVILLIIWSTESWMQLYHKSYHVIVFTTSLSPLITSIIASWWLDSYFGSACVFLFSSVLNVHVISLLLRKMWQYLFLFPLYTVNHKKVHPFDFYNKFVKCSPNVIIFGRNIASSILCRIPRVQFHLSPKFAHKELVWDSFASPSVCLC